MRYIAFVLVFISSLLLVFCNNDNKCYSVENAVVESVSGSVIGSVNTPIVITVDFYAINGCGSFHSISESRKNFEVTINVKVAYNGCVCSDMLVGFKQDFIFVASEPGVYSLVFNNAFLENIVKTITIN